MGTLVNALNEVCNGIDIFEFETRLGASLDEVKSLMIGLKSLFDKTNATE